MRVVRIQNYCSDTLIVIKLSFNSEDIWGTVFLHAGLMKLMAFHLT